MRQLEEVKGHRGQWKEGKGTPETEEKKKKVITLLATVQINSFVFQTHNKEGKFYPLAISRMCHLSKQKKL